MDNATQPEVVIYSTPTCHFCALSKDYFTKHNVAFTNHDVASDFAKRQEMIEMTGQMGVPVIRIGNDVVIGFDKPKLAELLNIKD
jgi:glutaredoxin-like YruB-family protein